MAGGIDGFESDWLDRRIEFLLDRAKAHLENGDTRSRACAATLYRDAAAIAFMRSDRQSGRDHLYEAGLHFLELGLPHGVLLMMLSSEGQKGTNPLTLMFRAATAEGDRRAAAREELGPLFASALHQPEQLLALEVAAAMAEAANTLDSRREAGVRNLLHPYRAHSAGASGLSVAAFMRLMDFGQGDEFENLESSGNIQLDVMTLFARRGRQLASAYEDRYHWRLLLSPAALLDFDLVALFAIWWAHGRSPKKEMPDLGSSLPPMMFLPMEVAQILHPRGERPLEG